MAVPCRHKPCRTPPQRGDPDPLPCSPPLASDAGMHEQEKGQQQCGHHDHDCGGMAALHDALLFKLPAHMPPPTGSPVVLNVA